MIFVMFLLFLTLLFSLLLFCKIDIKINFAAVKDPLLQKIAKVES